MEWWHRIVKRALVAVAGRASKSRKAGGGIGKLGDEVRTCGYSDVQVMWEMLRRAEMEIAAAEDKRSIRSA